MSGPTLIQKRVLAYLINDITNKHPKKLLLSDKNSKSRFWLCNLL